MAKKGMKKVAGRWVTPEEAATKPVAEKAVIGNQVTDDMKEPNAEYGELVNLKMGDEMNIMVHTSTEGIDTTSAMRVPGGFIYKLSHADPFNRNPVIMGMVFVPMALS